MAEKMIAQHVEKVEKGVKEIIRLQKDDFFRKPPEDQQKLRENGLLEATKVTNAYPKQAVQAKCPACASQAAVAGELTRTSDPKLEGESIVRKISILPTMFECAACGLKLDGYEKLHAACRAPHVGPRSDSACARALRRFHFGASEWERKGKNRWCVDCTPPC
jgi:hypothetical protein